MVADNSSNSTTSASSGTAHIESVLSSVQNWVAAQNSLTKSLSAIISSNHVNLNLSNFTTVLSSVLPPILMTILSTVAFSTTAGTGNGSVTTINTGVGLTGGPISTSGTIAVSLTTLTNSLTSDHLLNNISSYFDGPSVAQGSSGTWFASGSVTVLDTGAAGTIAIKLWDGTSVIASGEMNANAGTAMPATVVHLSGFITSPASNIKISCRDSNNTTGVIKFNASGNSKDSTVSAIRIG